MTYMIEENDFYYIPTPEDADYRFDPTVWTRNIKKEVHTINEIFEACIAFNNVFPDVEITDGFENTLIRMVSNASSEKPSHPEHYYTNRHEILIYPKEEE